MAAVSFRDLTVWQKAMDLSVEVYRLSASFPADERFRLTAQVTRAAVSVPANIAEGNARGTRKDYAHFVAIARGSLAETETFLLLAIRLRFLDEARAARAFALASEVGRMLNALRSRLTEAR
jgi:four helix bundle protein